MDSAIFQIESAECARRIFFLLSYFHPVSEFFITTPLNTGSENSILVPQPMIRKGRLFSCENI